MERLKHIKNTLVDYIQSHMTDLSCVDTHELGEAIDMIKDMEEAIYYCHVSQAMEESNSEEIVRHATTKEHHKEEEKEK
jgi:hypothetical protein